MLTEASSAKVEVAATALAAEPQQASESRDREAGRVVWDAPTLPYIDPQDKVPGDMEALVDLEGSTQPTAVITGFGGRAKDGDLVALKVWYAEIGADGSLGSSQTISAGREPGDSLECEIQLPAGWVAVGFGIKSGDDVTNTVLYARQWDAGTRNLLGQPKAFYPDGKTAADVDKQTPETPSLDPDLADKLVLIGIGVGVKDDHVNRIWAKYAALVVRDEDLDNPVSSYAAYLPGSALEFAAGASRFSGAGRTLEMWIKPTGSGALASWCAYSTNDPNTPFLGRPLGGMLGSSLTYEYDSLILGLESDGCCSVSYVAREWNLTTYMMLVADSSKKWRTPPTRIFDGGWHHVAFVLDPGGPSVYFDGELLASKPMQVGIPKSAASKLLLGVDYQVTFGQSWQENLTDHYVGFLDEIRLWDQPRKAADVRAGFHTRIQDPTDGLIGLWSFDGRGLADHSGHGYDFTLRGDTPVVVPCTAADVVDPPAAPHVKSAGEPFPDHGRWAPGFQVRYAVSYYSDDPDTMLGPWESPIGPWSSWLAGTSAAYADLSGIATDPGGWAVGRKIYRQFMGQLPQRVGFLADNTTTTFDDRRS